MYRHANFSPLLTGVFLGISVELFGVDEAISCEGRSLQNYSKLPTKNNSHSNKNTNSNNDDEDESSKLQQP